MVSIAIGISVSKVQKPDGSQLNVFQTDMLTIICSAEKVMRNYIIIARIRAIFSDILNLWVSHIGFNHIFKL